MNTTTTTRMFLISPIGHEPILTITDDIHGPRDQATLYDAFGEENVKVVTVADSDIHDLAFSVYASIEVLFREWFNIQLTRQEVAS